uniref:Uncharacterized protein n=1 Tax=Kalanchoe fedtschenkoi TaxID=63787 RepID=A0A7N1A743_KALFE
MPAMSKSVTVLSTSSLKGCLFARPPIPIHNLITHLKRGLSQTLSHFPALAGRLITDSNGYVYIVCNDSGAGFIHANANRITIHEVLSPYSDVTNCYKKFFAMDRTVSYDGHFKPILTVQVTELLDGLFIGCAVNRAVNHVVVDGTSLWNFFNTFAEVCRGADKIMKLSDFSRSSPLISPVVLRVAPGDPMVTFSGDASLRERIFSFSRESILKLKNKINHSAAHGNLRPWLQSDMEIGMLKSMTNIWIIGYSSNVFTRIVTIRFTNMEGLNLSTIYNEFTIYI